MTNTTSSVALRADNRRADEMRPIVITPHASRFAEGSCLIEFGLTRVLVTATVEEQVPPFLRGSKKGWVTAEYAMLPRATENRLDRERQLRDGRAKEIQRMIGRCLRASIDLQKLGERQIKIDCDVLSADGGTRTASLSGAWVAMALAVQHLRAVGLLTASPMKYQLAAVSVALVDQQPLLDVDYNEDANSSADGTFVITDGDKLLELQLAAERAAFSDDDVTAMLGLARRGVVAIFTKQNEALAVGR